MKIIRLATANPYRTLTILLILSLIIFFTSIPLNRGKGILIGGDGIWYFMYTRSLVIDHDIHFANEYEYFHSKDPLTKEMGVMSVTQTGFIFNKYSIGPGILWMPFFIIAHAISLVLNYFGLHISTDGYSYIYQAAICIGSIIYGFLGMILVYSATKKYYPDTALSACLLLWLASNGIHYQIVQPSMAHMCSFFSVSLLLFTWIKYRPVQNLRHWLLIGLAGGLVGIVRQPDATFLLLPIFDGILDRSMSVMDKFKSLSILTFGFFVIFSIQLATWTIIYGSPLINGYTSYGEGFSWLSPKILEILFSTNHGLFLWHPILLIAVFGLLHFQYLDRKLASLLACGLLMQIYLIGSWSTWFQGDSFGGRMFIASFPLLIIGLGGSLSWAISKYFSKIVWFIGLILIGWNALFLIQYTFAYIPHQGPLTFEQFFQGKLIMIIDIVQKTALFSNNIFHIS